MNKTFKVARSLTRGTVVTSEKASSYQGKAVKTVIAAAVALVAGSAMAAAVPTQDAAGNIKVTGNITVTGTDVVPSKNGTVLQYDATSWKDVAEQSGTVSYNNVIFLDNGALKVQAKADGTVAGDFSVKEIVGTGTLSVSAVNKAGSVATAQGSTLKIGTAGLGNHEGDNLTVAFTSTGATAKIDEQGVATIELAGSAEIGHVGDLPKKNGVVNFTVDENTNALVESTVAGTDLSINNATFSNSGRLAFKAVDGQNIALKSVMDTTNDKGVYVFENALTATNGAAYTGTTVYVGAADATDDAAKAAKTFLVKGATIGNGTDAGEQTKTSTFTADTLTLADTNAAGFSVVGGGKAELKTVNVTAGEFSTVAATDTDYNGYANVGTLTASKAGKVTLGGTTDVGTLSILAGEDHTANGTTTVSTLTIGDLSATGSAKLTVGTKAEFVVTGDTVLQAKETGSSGSLSVSDAASLELQGKTAVNEYGVLSIENTTMTSLGEVTVNKGTFSIAGTSAKDYEADIQSLTVTDGTASIDGVEIVLNSVNIAEGKTLAVGGTTAATVELGTLTGKGTYSC